MRAGYCQRPLTISNYDYRRKSGINVFLNIESRRLIIIIIELAVRWRTILMAENDVIWRCAVCVCVHASHYADDDNTIGDCRK